ncbi:hypothetical protein [Streptomyces sp. 2131.1]|uniref:hypothetical protein n=1 Tax=Streptomyces sp. 2131.1 TaxID=1855346 RepID=UPI00210A07F3|nr:hypothetical protein [Streptomyces sp. 2131.1]
MPVREQVSFVGAKGKLAGNLYLPDADAAAAAAGVLVACTWTSVKEQMANRYTQELAARGMRRCRSTSPGTASPRARRVITSRLR